VGPEASWNIFFSNFAPPSCAHTKFSFARALLSADFLGSLGASSSLPIRPSTSVFFKFRIDGTFFFCYRTDIASKVVFFFDSALKSRLLSICQTIPLPALVVSVDYFRVSGSGFC